MDKFDRGLSIIIPVYNSQNILPQLIKELNKVLGDLNQAYEIILVNDGSHDESWRVIDALSKSNDRVQSIDLIRNYGQHNALLCGIRQARYDVIVTLDDDLQNPPSEIPRLLAKLQEGYDVVYGSPQKMRENIWRKFASQLVRHVLSKMMGSENASKVSSFRAIRTRVRDAFANYSNPKVFIDVLLTWGGTRFSFVPVKHNSRKEGTSTYSFRKLMNLAIDMITGFSTLPLRAASIIGFLFTLFGLGVFLYVIIQYIINGGSIPSTSPAYSSNRWDNRRTSFVRIKTDGYRNFRVNLNEYRYGSTPI
jgi:glycosyltransferase involved in cell wall biosynthesis